MSDLKSHTIKAQFDYYKYQESRNKAYQNIYDLKKAHEQANTSAGKRFRNVYCNVSATNRNLLERSRMMRTRL